MKETITVIFSSQLSDEENQKFISHIDSTIGVNHKVICYSNHNQYSLSEIYNNAIKKYKTDNGIFVMCHNDIFFKTKGWGKLLLAKFNNTNFDIIGVAGSTYLPSSGIWWEDRKKMVGIVEHTDGYQTWVSQYSPEIFGVKETVIIDGVFMAFNPNTIVHGFDEDFKGFHFYDLAFCIPNYLDGCNIGVTTVIRIIHQSVGKTNLQWENSRIQFIKKYEDELPIVYTNSESTKDDIIVNILTRTHGRPEYFKKCKKSILEQTYKKINHIVGTDTKCDYYDDAIVLLPKSTQQPQLMPERGTYPAPWNLHLNELATYVKDGWVMYLDDDDMFSHKNALKLIVSNIENDDQILLWRVKIKINEQGWIVPDDKAFGKSIEAGNFSGIGMMFHSKYLPVDWGSWSFGDFRVGRQLLAKGLKPKWIDLILTETQGKPNNGKLSTK